MHSGDADLISKADSLKNEVAIQKEKCVLQNKNKKRLMHNINNHNNKLSTTTTRKPSCATNTRGFEWKSKNSWFGENAEATQYAQYTHMNLVNEGFEPTQKNITLS